MPQNNSDPKLGLFFDIETYLSKYKSSALSKKILRIFNFLVTRYLNMEVALLPTFLEISSPFSHELQVQAKSLIELGFLEELILHPRYFNDEPFIFATEAAPRGFGRDFFDQELSVKKALSEAVERSVWELSDAHYRGKDTVSSYKNLSGQKINILSISGFSEEQKKIHAQLQFTENTPFSWIPVHSFISEREIYCPTSLFSLKHVNENPEPMLRWCVSTGQATRSCSTDALLGAILEIIERDAFMITYLNSIEAPKINTQTLSEQDPKIRKILASTSRHNLETHLFALPTDFPVYVVLAVVIDRTGLGPALTVGASCGFDIHNCSGHALAEAVTIRHFLKDKYNTRTDSGHFEIIERMLYWGKIENTHKLNFLLLSKNEYPINGEQLVPRDTKSKLELVKKSFTEKGYEVCFVETSTEKLNKLGFSSIAAFSPEMQPLYLDESIPYHGGKRLSEVPLKLGYTSASRFNTVPHPFS